MTKLILIIAMIFIPAVVCAEWKDFEPSAGEEQTFLFGKTKIVFKQSDKPSEHFPEDSFTMIIIRGKYEIKHNFTSSYAGGKFLYDRGYLFLEYGIGRGTRVRTEHIKGFKLLQDQLIELFDLPVSYYVPSPIEGDWGPYKFDYKVKIINKKEGIVIRFYSNDKRFGMPTRKEVMIKHD